jgi:transcriptional regulator with XRE-family HTH domain
MTERFKTLLEKLGITSSEFADRIGVQRSSISHILSGRNKPSIDFLEKLINAFPDTDVTWLITGKAATIKSAEKEKSEPDSQTVVPENTVQITIPENKTPAVQSAAPVEKVILIYSDNTFRILNSFGN